LALLEYRKTPVIEILDPIADRAGIRLLLNREYLNHPYVSGNKWWKLKYNLEEAIRLGHHTLLTFGGAYSNHLFATAAAANELGLKSIGIVRGEEHATLNPTLAFVQQKGMKLEYISREDYRRKDDSTFIQKLNEKYGSVYVLPEGGTNALAIKGCAEFAQSLLDENPMDHLCLSVGTGGTLVGMIQGLKGEHNILGFSALKGGTFLNEQVRKWLETGSSSYNNWHIETEYHFGGYGKRTQILLDFIHRQQSTHGLPLDPVYTSKMFFGVLDKIAGGMFKRGSVVMAVHTGGLQGGSLLSE